jgi:short-subunit dehydrogenase
MHKERALISGASSGIGLALSHEFARHGHPLILSAPVESELHTISRELSSKHNVDVQFIAADLEQPDACDRLFSVAQSLGGIGIVANNAGEVSEHKRRRGYV